MLLVAAATYTAFPRAHVSLPHNGHSPALTTAGLGHMASITCIETAQHVVSTTVFSAIKYVHSNCVCGAILIIILVRLPLLCNIQYLRFHGFMPVFHTMTIRLL